MKKITIFLAVFSFVFIHSIQADIRLGVKAGANLANASFNIDAIQTSNFTGFQVGPVLEIGPVEVAALYNQQGLKFKFDELDFEKKESRLDVPVNLKLKLGVGSLLCGFLTAGPYASFKLSGDDFSEAANGVVNAFKNKDFGAGINVGGGIELSGHLQIGVNYKISVTDDYKSFDVATDLTGLKGKARIWSITAAYFF
ncbi:MAG: PorT family protein [Dysgonamonadaceae bacterium]|jgi:hypothetical protein|nr:PorT family protein [Dysgonamonadaceae bacterium]